MDPLDRDPLERDLRDLLTDDRLTLPTHLVGIPAIRAGVTRRRRRRAAAGAVAATAVVAVVVGSAALSHPEVLTSGPVDSAASPTSGRPTSTASPTPTAPAGVGLAQPLERRGRDVGDGDQHPHPRRARPDHRPLRPSCLRLAESRDGGDTWSGLPVPADTAVNDVEGGRAGNAAYVRFGSATDGWLFGGGLWSTHDGGQGWSEVDPSRPGAPARGRGRHGLGAGGRRRSRDEQLWSSPVGSDDWQRADGIDVTGPADLAVQGTRVVVLGTGDAAWTNASGDFARVPNPCASAVDVRLSGSGSLWATCVTGTAAFLATSDDDGSSWTTVPVDTGQGALPNSVSVGARMPDEAVVGSPSNRCHGSRPTVGWPPCPTRRPAAAVGYLGFTSGDVGYAVVGSALWRTDDGAETWHRLEITTSPR